MSVSRTDSGHIVRCGRIEKIRIEPPQEMEDNATSLALHGSEISAFVMLSGLHVLLAVAEATAPPGSREIEES